MFGGPPYPSADILCYAMLCYAMVDAKCCLLAGLLWRMLRLYYMLWWIWHSPYLLDQFFLHRKSSWLLENGLEPSFWFPFGLSSKEISAAATTSTQTFRRTIPVLSLHLVGFCFRDDIRVLVIHVVEREFRPRGNGLGGEEGEIVNVDVGVVVRDGVDGAVGVARVVDEAGGATEVHAVTHVLRASFFLGPFVESH